MLSKVTIILMFATIGFGTGVAEAQRYTTHGRSVVRDPNFTFQKPVESWRERKTKHVVMQQRDYSCGAAALATLLRYYWGHNVNENMVLGVIENMLTDEELLERSSEGLTMADLESAAVKMGYKASVGEIKFSKLVESKVPVILVINLGGVNHFVVLRDIVGNCAFLADPLRGNTRVSTTTLQRTWVKNAILVVAPGDETQSYRSQMGVTAAERSEGYLNRQVIRRQITGVGTNR
ncbi:MAG: hypothetical protein HKN47_12575 [Pirellulaceae bacterium]|nr:hypothetical protein [Pirellulaceae bacterium]